MTFRARPFSICSAVFVVALISTLSYAQETAVAVATHAGEVGDAAVSLKLVSEVTHIEELFSDSKTLRQLNFRSLPEDEKAAAEEIFHNAQKKGANIGETAEQIALKLKSMGAKLPTLASAGDVADLKIAQYHVTHGINLTEDDFRALAKESVADHTANGTTPTSSFSGHADGTYSYDQGPLAGRKYPSLNAATADGQRLSAAEAEEKSLQLKQPGPPDPFVEKFAMDMGPDKGAWNMAVGDACVKYNGKVPTSETGAAQVEKYIEERTKAIAQAQRELAKPGENPTYATDMKVRIRADEIQAAERKTAISALRSQVDSSMKAEARAATIPGHGEADPNITAIMGQRKKALENLIDAMVDDAQIRGLSQEDTVKEISASLAPLTSEHGFTGESTYVNDQVNAYYRALSLKAQLSN